MLFLAFGCTKVEKEQKFCSGVKIVFFPGGNPSDSFAPIVYNGAKQAENDLGPTVQYIWSDWDSQKMVSQFKDAISTSPDAISIMGHPGPEVLSPLVDEAERKGIIVTLANVDIPEIRNKYVAKYRLFYYNTICNKNNWRS